jgi:hypothetical protein
MDEEPIQMNIKIKPSVAAALRRYAFETTGQMRGISDIAEKAIREYLEKHGVIIENGKSENPLMPLIAIPALEAISA